MKRINNLYDRMLDFDKLLEIYNLIKYNCRSKNRVVEFSKSLNANLIEILTRLKKENYFFHKYNVFLIKKPKYRIIMSENIPDKIVNHLLSRLILVPILEPGLIDTNVATRREKGTEYAFNYICKCLNKLKNKKSIYILKIDITKYFYNIDHDILKAKLEKRIKDQKNY